MDREVVGARRAAWATLMFALLWSARDEAHALALRGPSADMRISSIPLGRASGAGRPMGKVTVANTGDEPVEVVMRLAATRPVELKDGYEPAPELSWARLTRTRLKIPPGAEGESPLLVALPPDRSLLGGQYQLEWIGEASAPSGARLELRSRVLLDVVPEDGAPAQVRRAGQGALNFALSPPEGRLEKVPLGRKKDLRELGLKVKLENMDQRAVSFRLSLSIDTLDNKNHEEGFEPAPNPHFLKPASPVVSVGPDSVGEARFFLQIPDERRYRGRSWIFVVHVEPLEADEAAAKDFRLLVRTQQEAAM